MVGNVLSTNPQGPPGPGALTAQAVLTPTSSSFQLVANSYQPVDVRDGAVPLLAPLNPTEGTLFAVFDAYGASTTNAISVTAQGSGVTIVNPQWDGSGSPYQSAASLVGTLGVWTYRFSQALNAWLPADGGTGGTGSGSLAQSYVTGPATVAAVPNRLYIVSLAGGSVTIDAPVLSAGQSIGVLLDASAALNGTLVVNAGEGQVLQRPGPNQTTFVSSSTDVSAPGAGLVWTNAGSAPVSGNTPLLLTP